MPSRPITREQVAVVAERLRAQLPRIQATVARSSLARVQGINPRRVKQIVDGREGAPLESVKPGGNIRFLFADAKLGEVLEWLYVTLRERSPVGPERGQPHYRDVHWLFVDGVFVPPSAAGAIRIRESARFVNARPYARRLEHGWSMQAPDGVYELVSFEAERRFPEATFSFSYLTLAEVPAPIPWPVKPWYGFPSILVTLR